MRPPHPSTRTCGTAQTFFRSHTPAGAAPPPNCSHSHGHNHAHAFSHPPTPTPPQDFSGATVIPGGNTLTGEDTLLICNNNPLIGDGVLKMWEYTAPKAAGAAPVLLRTIVMDGFDDTEGLTLVKHTATTAQIVVTEEGRLNLVLLTIPKYTGANLHTVVYATGVDKVQYSTAVYTSPTSTRYIKQTTRVSYTPLVSIVKRPTHTFTDVQC